MGKDEVWIITCPKKNRFASTNFRLAIQPVFVPFPNGKDGRLLLKLRNDWKPSKDLRQNEANRQVLEYIREHPGVNRQTIQTALKMGDRTVRAALWANRKNGVLKFTKGPRNELCWYLADEEELLSETDLHRYMHSAAENAPLYAHKRAASARPHRWSSLIVKLKPIKTQPERNKAKRLTGAE